MKVATLECCEAFERLRGSFINNNVNISCHFELSSK